MYTYLLKSQWQSVFLFIWVQKELKPSPFLTLAQQKTSSTLIMLNGCIYQSEKCPIPENYSMSTEWKTKQDSYNRVVQSCHLLVCLFIYRHFTIKLAISEYDRWHLFVIYYAYLILTYCWFDSNVDKQKRQLWTTLILHWPSNTHRVHPH